MLITTIMVVNNNSVNRINLLTIIINTINTINHDWPILLTNINHEVLSAPLESSSAATSLMSRTRGHPTHLANANAEKKLSFATKNRHFFTGTMV